MFKMAIKNNFHFPKVTLQEDLRVIAKRFIIPVLAENINNQKDVNGRAFQKVEESTQKTKDRKGQGNKSLIADGKLVSAFMQKDSGKSKVVVKIHSIRSKIAGYLQVDGVGEKKKKFVFFGISKRMEASAMTYMRKRIKEIFDAK